ncbi:hypothetical protein ACS5PK_08305 [Roseateles sp. DB2]|uniref:hypothetical protein n=1 Tax=Roseateles sp. DB2 TaxID=3453717 RepID=UPI003EE888FE
MSYQVLLTIFSSCFGFVSALWFGIGALLMGPSKIIKTSDDSWDANPGMAEALISQSAEYLAGGALLALSFVFQILSTQASIDVIRCGGPFLGSPWVIALVGIFFGFVISYPIFLLRRSNLRRRVSAQKPGTSLV